MAAPIILAFFSFWKIYKKTSFIKAEEADLISGRREMNLKELMEQEREEKLNWNWYQRYLSLSDLTDN